MACISYTSKEKEREREGRGRREGREGSPCRKFLATPLVVCLQYFAQMYMMTVGVSRDRGPEMPAIQSLTITDCP